MKRLGTLRIACYPALAILSIVFGAGLLEAEEVPSHTVIMALGDSITAGAPAFRSPAEFPPDGHGNPQSQYGYWIEKKHPEWKLINRGISGQTSAQILARLNQELETFKPEKVILMAGVNDIFQGYPAEVTIQNLQSLYDELSRRGIPVMTLTILPYRGLTPEKFARLQKINQWIKSDAAQKELGFCDTFAVMHAPGNPKELLGTPDGLHPDAASYQIMGVAITAALEQWPPLSAPAKKTS